MAKTVTIIVVVFTIFFGNAQTHNDLYNKLAYAEKSESMVKNTIDAISSRYPFINTAQWNQIKSKITYNKYKTQVVDLLKKHYSTAEVKTIFTENANNSDAFRFNIKPAGEEELYKIGKLNGRELGLQITLHLNNLLSSTSYVIPGTIATPAHQTDITGTWNRKPDRNFYGTICTKINGSEIKEFYNAEMDLAGKTKEIRNNDRIKFPPAKPINIKKYHLSDICAAYDPNKVNKVYKGNYIITDQNECYSIQDFSKTNGTDAYKNVVTKRLAYKKIHDKNSSFFTLKIGNPIPCYGVNKTCEERYGYKVRFNNTGCKCDYERIDFGKVYRLAKQSVEEICNRPYATSIKVSSHEYDFFSFFGDLANVIQHDTNSYINASARQERREIAELMKDIPTFFYGGEITKTEMYELYKTGCDYRYLSKANILAVKNN